MAHHHVADAVSVTRDRHADAADAVSVTRDLFTRALSV
jgi:hypothetical protein